VGVDVEVVIDLDVRSDFGVLIVVIRGAEAKPSMDNMTARVEGGAGENVKVMFDDDLVLESRLF
jgi:hypothetical protein